MVKDFIPFFPVSGRGGATYRIGKKIGAERNRAIRPVFAAHWGRGGLAKSSNLKAFFKETE